MVKSNRFSLGMPVARALLSAVLLQSMLLSSSVAGSGRASAEVQLVLTGADCPIFADGLNGLDLLTGNGVTLEFTAQAKSSSLQSSSSLGFTVYSPIGSVGALVSSLSLASDWASSSVYWTSGGGSLALTDVDGTLPESWLVSGSASAGGGFLETNFVDVFSFSVTLPDDGVICIDTAFIAPAGQWLMVPDGPPSWFGGGGDGPVGGTHTNAFCISSFVVGGLDPQFSTCVDSVTTSYCETVDFQVTATDPDPPFLTVFYDVSHDGAGSAEVDGDGNVSYTPGLADANSLVTVTTFARKASTCGPGTSCQTKIAVTHDALQIACGPNAGMIAGQWATLPAPVIINAEPCGVYRWSLVSVNPVPTGLVVVDSLTGAITFFSDRSDGFGGMGTDYNIVVSVSDGVEEKFCASVVSFFGTTAACCLVAGDADDSGSMNIGDVTFLIARIFLGGAAPSCCGAVDVNSDNSMNIADVTFLIARIFSGGPAPQCGMGEFICN